MKASQIRKPLTRRPAEIHARLEVLREMQIDFCDNSAKLDEIYDEMEALKRELYRNQPEAIAMLESRLVDWTN